MPLVTRIERDGKNVKPDGGWDFVALSCFMTAACAESSPRKKLTDDGLTAKEVEEQGKFINFSMVPIYYIDWADVITKGKQVLKRDHVFDLGERKIELKAGDVLTAHRDHR